MSILHYELEGVWELTRKTHDIVNETDLHFQYARSASSDIYEFVLD